MIILNIYTKIVLLDHQLMDFHGNFRPPSSLSTPPANREPLRSADLMQQKEANALKDRKVAEPEWSGTPKFGWIWWWGRGQIQGNDEKVSLHVMGPVVI